jgi:hypothetical protein
VNVASIIRTMRWLSSSVIFNFPLLVAVVLAEACSFGRVGIIRRGTVCRAWGIWSHSFHITSGRFFP